MCANHDLVNANVKKSVNSDLLLAKCEHEGQVSDVSGSLQPIFRWIRFHGVSVDNNSFVSGRRHTSHRKTNSSGGKGIINKFLPGRTSSKTDSFGGRKDYENVFF